MQMHLEDTQRLLRIALAEDIGNGDVTSERVIDAAAEAAMQFTARHQLVCAGLPMLQLVFPEQVEIKLIAQDGDVLEAGAPMAMVRGNARAILAAERVALNLLQRMCGVASLTRRYVDAVAGTGVRILDTRKTMPGLRMADKYAVRCGGGHNHRLRLDDAILIKDNHIALVGSISEAMKRATTPDNTLSIEVECDTLEQVEEALKAGANRLLLDNMAPEMLRKAVALTGGKAQLEASGGITLENVRAVAETGVNDISIGALTHSAPAADIGLDMLEGRA